MSFIIRSEWTVCHVAQGLLSEPRIQEQPVDLGSSARPVD